MVSLRRHDEEQRVHKHLLAAGIDRDLQSLASAGSSYPAQAIPVLLRELDEPYSEMTLEMVARAISHRASRPYWDELIARYKAGTPGEIPNCGLLVGLAVVISELATKQDLEQLIDLASDRSRGMSRVMFFNLVSRWGGNRGIQVVRAQLEDPLARAQANVVLERADKKHAAALKRLSKAAAERPDPVLAVDAEEWSTSFDSGDWGAFSKYLAKQLAGELGAEVGKAALAVISTAPLDDEGAVRLNTDLGVIEIGWFIDDDDTVDLSVWGSPAVRDLCDAWFA